MPALIAQVVAGFVRYQGRHRLRSLYKFLAKNGVPIVLRAPMHNRHAVFREELVEAAQAMPALIAHEACDYLRYQGRHRLRSPLQVPREKRRADCASEPEAPAGGAGGFGSRARCGADPPETERLAMWPYWLVLGLGVLSVVVAAAVLTWDFIQAGGDEPRRSEIRTRLDDLHRKKATRVDQTRIADITTRRRGGAQ